MPDFSRLDAYLDREALDAYLVDADATDSNQRYLSGFDGPDPFRTLYRPAGVSILIKSLEYGRAKVDSDADDVRRPVDYGAQPYADAEAEFDALAAFLTEFDVESVGVSLRFPVGTADALRTRDVVVQADYDDVLAATRAVKTDSEIEEIRAAQHANEAALGAAEAAIADADVDGDRLVTEDGNPLTAEAVKVVIEKTLLERGYALDEMVVAGGEQGAAPHNRGSGPLPAHEPIVIDVFPRSKATRYHADMTRTVVRGAASEAVRERFEATKRALDAALAAIEPGVTGETVHDTVCDVFETAGYPTLRSDETTETGFIHSTGHGVGLDAHELPRVGPGGEELEPGHVVAIEPGLYDPRHGGMRLEDLVVVTDDGYENLTDHPYDLAL